jgi:hypothetical protein
MFSLQTSFNPLLLKGGGGVGGVKPVVEVTVNSKEETPKTLSQLRPRIRPQDTKREAVPVPLKLSEKPGKFCKVGSGSALYYSGSTTLVTGKWITYSV